MVNSIDTSGSSDIRTDYMKLLVTQLQNQNPLEPMDNNQMSAQLAQFSQLEQLEKMNSQFADVLSALDGTQASHLLGKQISFQPEHTDGLMPPVEGIVEEIQTSEDDIHLFVGNYQVKLSDVLSIKNP
jgi:flagellar basal-body rod modification protein FlgD